MSEHQVEHSVPDAPAGSTHDHHGPVNPEPGSGDAVPMLHVDRYESAWMRVSVAILAIFLLAITVSAYGNGFQLPGMDHGRIDPTTLYDAGSPFAQPALQELSPGKYEVYVRAQIWQFTPNEIRVPAGSEVTFHVTSADIQHGFKIMETNVNMMVLPGYISTLKATFDTPRTYNIVCHEFCGSGHHNMYATIIVEEAGEGETAQNATGTRSN